MLGGAAGLGLLLPQLAGAPAVSALPPDPEFVHTFEPETYAVPAKLLLARAKPGTTAQTVELPGSFTADNPCELLASAKGAVYLVVVTGSRKGEVERAAIELWDVRRPKPQRLATVREGSSFHGLAAALEGEDQLHVVFNGEEG